jgi:hypothetical protein
VTVARTTFLLSAAALALVALPGAAADLATFRRPLSREPAYDSGRPRYCLLVFGPEATNRIWLVIDGHSLYADRNGNGDITEPGKRKKAVTWGGEEGTLFEFGAVTRLDGRKVHLRVLYGGRPDQPDGVSVSLGGMPFQSAGRDGQGLLHFADRPQDAPVIHFGGPLRIVPNETPAFRLSAGEQEISVRLGSPGHGSGTLALLDCDSVPADVHPVAEVAFPNRAAGGEPVKVRVVLRHRC